MKRKGIVLLAVILLAAAGVAAVLLNGNQNKPEAGSPNPEPSANMQAEKLPQETEPEGAVQTEDGPQATEQAAEKAVPEKEQPFLVQITEDDPSIAYVLVRMQNTAGLLPLPLEGEYTRTLRQAMADGTEAVNVLHLTPNGFWMEDANCEGHDCVNEGEVTLENREERVLWNMVICLPHQLSAELITREEAQQMFR